MKISFFKSLAIIGIFLGGMTSSVHASYAAGRAQFNTNKTKLDTLLKKNSQYIKNEKARAAFKKEAEKLLATLIPSAQLGGIKEKFTEKNKKAYQNEINKRLKVVKKETTKAEMLPEFLSSPINDIKQNEDKVFAKIREELEENLMGFTKLENYKYPSINVGAMFIELDGLTKDFMALYDVLETKSAYFRTDKAKIVEDFFKVHGFAYYLLVDGLMKNLFTYLMNDERAELINKTWGDRTITGTVLSKPMIGRNKGGSYTDEYNLLGLLGMFYNRKHPLKVVTDPDQAKQKGYSRYNGQTFIYDCGNFFIKAIGYVREALRLIYALQEPLAIAKNIARYSKDKALVVHHFNAIQNTLREVKKRVMQYIDYANDMIQEANALVQNAQDNSVSFILSDDSTGQAPIQEYREAIRRYVFNPMEDLYGVIEKYGDEFFAQSPVQDLDSKDDFEGWLNNWNEILDSWKTTLILGSGQELDSFDAINQEITNVMEGMWQQWLEFQNGELADADGKALYSSDKDSIGIFIEKYQFFADNMCEAIQNKEIVTTQNEFNALVDKLDRFVDAFNTKLDAEKVAEGMRVNNPFPYTYDYPKVRTVEELQGLFEGEEGSEASSEASEEELKGLGELENVKQESQAEMLARIESAAGEGGRKRLVRSAELEHSAEIKRKKEFGEVKKVAAAAAKEAYVGPVLPIAPRVMPIHPEPFVSPKEAENERKLAKSREERAENERKLAEVEGKNKEAEARELRNRDLAERQRTLEVEKAAEEATALPPVFVTKVNKAEEVAALPPGIAAVERKEREPSPFRVPVGKKRVGGKPQVEPEEFNPRKQTGESTGLELFEGQPTVEREAASKAAYDELGKKIADSLRTFIFVFESLIEVYTQNKTKVLLEKIRRQRKAGQKILNSLAKKINKKKKVLVSNDLDALKKSVLNKIENLNQSLSVSVVDIAPFVDPWEDLVVGEPLDENSIKKNIDTLKVSATSYIKKLREPILPREKTLGSGTENRWNREIIWIKDSINELDVNPSKKIVLQQELSECIATINNMLKQVTMLGSSVRRPKGETPGVIVLEDPFAGAQLQGPENLEESEQPLKRKVRKKKAVAIKPAKEPEPFMIEPIMPKKAVEPEKRRGRSPSEKQLLGEEQEFSTAEKTGKKEGSRSRSRSSSESRESGSRSRSSSPSESPESPSESPERKSRSRSRSRSRKKSKSPEKTEKSESKIKPLPESENLEAAVYLGQMGEEPKESIFKEAVTGSVLPQEPSGSIFGTPISVSEIDAKAIKNFDDRIKKFNKDALDDIYTIRHPEKGVIVDFKGTQDRISDGIARDIKDSFLPEEDKKMLEQTLSNIIQEINLALFSEPDIELLKNPYLISPFGAKLERVSEPEKKEFVRGIPDMSMPEPKISMPFEKSEISTGSSNVSREPEFEKSVHGGESEEKESLDVLTIRDDIQSCRKNELNNTNLVRLSAEDVSIVNKEKDQLDEYMDELNQRIAKLKVSPEKKQELIKELEKFITDANKEFELYDVYSSKVPKTYMQLKPLYPIIEPEEELVWEEIEVPSEEQLQKEKNAELGIEADIESFKNNFGSDDAIGALLMQSVPERLEWQTKADERIGEINIKIDFNISEENRPALRKKLDDLIKNINEKLQKFKVYNSNIIENILQLLPPVWKEIEVPSEEQLQKEKSESKIKPLPEDIYDF